MSGPVPVPRRPPPIVLKRDTLTDRALSVGLWAVGGAWMLGTMGTMGLLRRRFSARQLHLGDRILTFGQVALTGSRLHHVVDPGIDPGRPYMFFQNHVSQIDHCTAYNATPHFKQGVELASHFALPIYGPYMRGRGTIAVSQEFAGLKTLLSRMREEMSIGHSLLIFPEGTRTLTGRLGQLQPGVFRIAQRLGAAIVPTTVTGMFRVMRKGSLMIRPGYDVTVYCDAPVETTDYGRREIPALMERVGSVMRARIDDYWAHSEPQPSLLPRPALSR